MYRCIKRIARSVLFTFLPPNFNLFLVFFLCVCRTCNTTVALVLVVTNHCCRDVKNIVCLLLIGYTDRIGAASLLGSVL